MIMYLMISFIACLVGAICGIGGGVIVKPVLDLFGWDSVVTISFLSNCMVLAMSISAVIKSLLSKDNEIKLKDITPLAIGAAIGGILGGYIFTFIKNQFVNSNMVGAIQAILLTIISIGVLLYTVFKEKIKTHHMTGFISCGFVGLFLGIISSFLGIGGGPINMIVLFFLFSMESKVAAINSLYIILISKITNIFSTIFTQNVPEFNVSSLIYIVVGAILGSLLGRRVNKKIKNEDIDKLFIVLMSVIILISGYNAWQYAMPSFL